MRTTVRTTIDGRLAAIVSVATCDLYRTTGGDREVIFDVDALATRSDGPIVGRLIPF